VAQTPTRCASRNASERNSMLSRGRELPRPMIDAPSLPEKSLGRNGHRLSKQWDGKKHQCRNLSPDSHISSFDDVGFYAGACSLTI
jgi:hypothetical protein